MRNDKSPQSAIDKQKFLPQQAESQLGVSASSTIIQEWLSTSNNTHSSFCIA